MNENWDWCGTSAMEAAQLRQAQAVENCLQCVAEVDHPVHDDGEENWEHDQNLLESS